MNGLFPQIESNCGRLEAGLGRTVHKSGDKGRSDIFTSLNDRSIPQLRSLLFFALVVGVSSCKKKEEIPSAPTLQLPVSDATSVSHFPTSSWNTVEDADTYEVQTSTSGSSFSGTDLMDQTGTSSTSFKNTTLYSGNDLYYWRVRAKNGEGDGPWSEVRVFGVDNNSPDQAGPVFGAIMLYDPTLSPAVSLYEISLTQSGPRTLGCAGPWPSDCNAEPSCAFVRYTGIYSTNYYVTVTYAYASGPNTGQTAFNGTISGSLDSCQRINVHDL